MNFLKKGPELKLPELKVPDFLFDLYYDLKERHLLPLVAVLAISIVVVPIALSQTTGSSSVPEETPIATPSAAGGEASTLTVSRSTPGLREYRRRLRDAGALDPFREASEAAAASEGSGGGSASESSTATEATESPSAPAEVPVESESSPAASVPSEFESSSTTTETKTRTKYASDSVDIRVVAVPASAENARASAKPASQVRRGLPELTMLPSREAPAAIFMGTSSDGKKALLLVSSDVQSIFGDGQCIVGSQTCQLLALEAGVPETFVYGPQARTYRIEILKIIKTLGNEPRKASLGKPKHKAGSGHEAPESAGRISAAQPR